MPTTTSVTDLPAWSAVQASIAAAGFGAGPAEAARSEWVSTEFECAPRLGHGGGR